MRGNIPTKDSYFKVFRAQSGCRAYLKNLQKVFTINPLVEVLGNLQEKGRLWVLKENPHP